MSYETECDDLRDPDTICDKCGRRVSAVEAWPGAEGGTLCPDCHLDEEEAAGNTG